MNLPDLPVSPGCHVVVFGAGGSAPKYYEWAKGQAATVVAPSTMLLPLQAAGVKPDYTCVIDPSAVMPLHFKNADTSRSLVYLPSVVDRCYRSWNGPKYRVWDLPGPSVIHLCIDVALRIGAASVSLVGCDFCYVGGTSHAPGVVTRYAVTEKESVIRQNGRGEPVLTEISLCEYVDTLEKQIAGRPDVTWARMGTDGLPVAGAVIR